MIGVRLADEPGAPCWYELVTHDVARATRFYADFFGWTPTEKNIPTVGPYTVARLGEQAAVGLMSIPKEWGTWAARWQVNFAVADCARGVSEAVSLGGRVITGPNRVPETGTFAVLADPLDAVFVIFELP